MTTHRTMVALSVATTLLHLAAAPGYGIFRDELYYLACARHLDWGYVDHPPLVALVGWIVSHTIGTSVVAIRVFPAVCAGITVWIAAAITRRLGGGSFAQTLAAVATALAPIYLSLFSIFSMNAFDLVIWAALMLIALVALESTDGRWWLAFGALAGLGLQNKISVLFLGFGIAMGLVAAREWRHLRDRRLWMGGAIAALIFAPHVGWQIAHGWPTVEFVRRATETKNLAFSPVEFLGEQALMMNPVALPLWLAGLVWLVAAPGGRRFRALGYAYLTVLLVMTTQNAKPYYLAPIYPALLAAGAVVVERASAGAWRAVRPIALVLVVASGAAFAPLAKPLLPVDTYVAYAAALGIAPGTSERHELGRLPQFFADMHGWQRLADEVANVHRALPPDDRERACIYGQNYGQAGAIDYFGPALGLPRAMSGHNNYWLWGPGTCDGRVVIVIGGRREDHERSFAEVTAAGRFECADCMPYESNLTLWVGRDLQAPIGEAWPRVKHFN